MYLFPFTTATVHTSSHGSLVKVMDPGFNSIWYPYELLETTGRASVQD